MSALDQSPVTAETAAAVPSQAAAARPLADR